MASSSVSSKVRQPTFIFGQVINFIALIIIALGLWQIPSYDNKLNFFLLLILACTAQLAITTSQMGGITYSIAPAISISAVPIYGPLGAALVEAIATLCIWFVKENPFETWKKQWASLSFNVSSSTISMFAGGVVWTYFIEIFGESIISLVIAWMLSALVVDQVNFFLIIILLYFRRNGNLNPYKVWREDLWATQLSVLVVGIGGGLLAITVTLYDSLGILIFFIPILLSAFAFRLYVKGMQTHLDNLENIVAERTEELEDLNRDKDHFLAILTHDMKTPLTSIGLYIDMLRYHPDILQEKPRILDTIQNSQQALLEIVNNIVDLEKLEANQTMTLNRQPFDLVELVDHAVELVEAQARHKEIQLTCNSVEAPLVANIDYYQYTRVVMNLLSNAIKYTPTKGCVQVVTSRQEGTAEIKVTDNGFGIPADELPFVFDRYRRVDAHKEKAAGTGLGLAISKAIALAHDGDIEVESVEGEGSCFAVRIPLESPIAAD